MIKFQHGIDFWKPNFILVETAENSFDSIGILKKRGLLLWVIRSCRITYPVCVYVLLRVLTFAAPWSDYQSIMAQYFLLLICIMNQFNDKYLSFPGVVYGSTNSFLCMCSHCHCHILEAHPPFQLALSQDPSSLFWGGSSMPTPSFAFSTSENGVSWPYIHG
jgi:hypothetical protein